MSGFGLALAWTISLHLWRGRLGQARELAAEGMQRAAGAEGQLIYNAELYWLAARMEADRAERARALGRPAEVEQAVRAASDAASELADAIARHPGRRRPSPVRSTRSQRQRASVQPTGTSSRRGTARRSVS